MKPTNWIIIALAAGLIGGFAGYKVSAASGTEPGYFDAVEAAGYGGGGEKIEGVSEEMQQYYKSLSSDE
jgi:hypothetical protein